MHAEIPEPIWAGKFARGSVAKGPDAASKTVFLENFDYSLGGAVESNELAKERVLCGYLYLTMTPYSQRYVRGRLRMLDASQLTVVRVCVGTTMARVTNQTFRMLGGLEGVRKGEEERRNVSHIKNWITIFP